MRLNLSSRSLQKVCRAKLKAKEQERLFDEQAQRNNQEENWEFPWKLKPGPQLDALNSCADELGFGGQAGGGKTALLLIAAIQRHRRAIIFRREYPRLKDIIFKSKILLGQSPASYNGNEKVWSGLPSIGQLHGERTLEFGACQYEDTKESWRGVEHDFVGFDEVNEMTRSQYRFLITWNRSSFLNQRSRVIAAFNPPSSSQGEWIIDYWAPWLDESHPDYPAEPGELRWFIVDGSEGEGREKDIEVIPDRWFIEVTERSEAQKNTSPVFKKIPVEVKDPKHISPIEHEGEFYLPRPEPVDYNGEEVEPRSRTFIRSRLEDNPYLDRTNYRANLQSLPEPLRSQLLKGIFIIKTSNDPWQLIYEDWVEQAFDRWRRRVPPRECDRLGVDVSRGGEDETVLAPAFREEWVGELVCIPGGQVRDGQTVVNEILKLHRHRMSVRIDVTGVGCSVFDLITEHNHGVMVSSARINTVMMIAGGSTEETTADGALRFFNNRSLWHWHVRELLNPENGATLALPPDKILKNQLTAPRWSVDKSTIAIETKKSMIARGRLKKSPDRSDAVIQALAEVYDYSWMENS